MWRQDPRAPLPDAAHLEECNCTRGFKGNYLRMKGLGRGLGDLKRSFLFRIPGLVLPYDLDR